jgi:hypothetical protein
MLPIDGLNREFHGPAHGYWFELRLDDKKS